MMNKKRIFMKTYSDIKTNYLKKCFFWGIKLPLILFIICFLYVISAEFSWNSIMLLIALVSIISLLNATLLANYMTITYSEYLFSVHSEIRDRFGKIEKFIKFNGKLFNMNVTNAPDFSDMLLLSRYLFFLWFRNPYRISESPFFYYKYFSGTIWVIIVFLIALIVSFCSFAVKVSMLS